MKREKDVNWKKRIAEQMNMKFNSFSPSKRKIMIIGFCLAASIISAYGIIEAVLEKPKNIPVVHHLTRQDSVNELRENYFRIFKK